MAYRLTLCFILSCGPIGGDTDTLLTDGEQIPTSTLNPTSTSTGGESSTSLDTTTTLPTTTEVSDPVCGNGLFEAGEECDSEPFCFECVRDRVIFVSSVAFDPVTLAGSGLDGADWICSTLAQKSGLADPGDDNWGQAWLSVDGNAAKDRIDPAPGRYALVDGTIVANSWSDLISGLQLLAPIRLDEFGVDEAENKSVWTATGVLGQWTSGDCLGWTEATDRATSTYGTPVLQTFGWTASGQAHCGNLLSVYCLERG